MSSVAGEFLSASLEDYLEAIFHIVEQKQVARVKDIAQRLNVNNSSVTGALRSLSQKKMVNYAPYDVITLTSRGKTAALDVIRRHEVLRDFMINVLAVDRQEAEEGACRMEHALPRGILERLTSLVDFISDSQQGEEAGWIENFKHQFNRDKNV